MKSTYLLAQLTLLALTCLVASSPVAQDDPVAIYNMPRFEWLQCGRFAGVASDYHGDILKRKYSEVEKERKEVEYGEPVDWTVDAGPDNCLRIGWDRYGACWWICNDNAWKIRVSKMEVVSWADNLQQTCGRNHTEARSKPFSAQGFIGGIPGKGNDKDGWYSHYNIVIAYCYYWSDKDGKKKPTDYRDDEGDYPASELWLHCSAYSLEDENCPVHEGSYYPNLPEGK